MVMGICGGYQMLGNTLRDPSHVESRVPEVSGLGLLDMDVTFAPEKRTVQSTGTVQCESGWLAGLNGLLLDGYEIHAGRNTFGPECVPWLTINGETDGVCNQTYNVIGTYLHGIFDDGLFFAGLADHIRKAKGIPDTHTRAQTLEEFREKEFDRIADIVRASLDMDAVYRIIRGKA